jgi:hypothetical protein
MCSYDVIRTPLTGSVKRESGWTGIKSANMYYACPYHSALDECLTIDLLVKNEPGQRVAIELDADSARALALAILETLDHELEHGQGHDHHHHDEPTHAA